MTRKIRNKVDNAKYTLWGRYSKGILIPIIITLCILCVGFIDAGAEAGNYPKVENATIKTVVTLDSGEEFVVSARETKVTVNTYNSSDPRDWEIGKW